MIFFTSEPWPIDPPHWPSGTYDDRGRPWSVRFISLFPSTIGARPVDKKWVGF